MSMGGSTDVAQPASRPERVVETEAEDIELGTADDEEESDLRTKGKRSLIKPSGAKAPVYSGLNV